MFSLFLSAEFLSFVISMWVFLIENPIFFKSIIERTHPSYLITFLFSNSQWFNLPLLWCFSTSIIVFVFFVSSLRKDKTNKLTDELMRTFSISAEKYNRGRSWLHFDPLVNHEENGSIIHSQRFCFNFNLLVNLKESQENKSKMIFSYLSYSNRRENHSRMMKLFFFNIIRCFHCNPLLINDDTNKY